MTINYEVEFNNIVNDILKNEEFIELKYEAHHGMTRLDHSLSVAKKTFKMCKKYKIKSIKETTRAALLHDFFKTSEIDGPMFLSHPKIAAINAKRVFNINEMQKNIIESHMFPATDIMPKYKESFIVSLADKMVAFKECTRYKVPLAAGTALLFFFNFMFIHR